MRYLGRDYTKREMLAYAGNIDQLAGATRLRLDEGNGDGARLIRVRNGSGLEFTLVESRCLDMLDMTYRGIPLNFLSKNGLVHPLRYLPQGGQDAQKYLAGGLFYTCGTANVGWECVDGGVQQVCHGRIKAMSAVNTAARAGWVGDDYEIEVRGEMRETALFAENVSLTRICRTNFGESVVRLTDIIENEGFGEQPFMYMYHLNLGFPLIDGDAAVFTRPAAISCRDPETQRFIPEYRSVDRPEYPGREVCLMHDFHEKGAVTTGVVNRRLGIGFYVRQDTRVMPFLHQWKTNIAGAYALGLEPANCHVEGRVREREVYGTLRTLKPFEKVRIDIELGVVEGAALDAFEAGFRREIT